MTRLFALMMTSSSSCVLTCGESRRFAHEILVGYSLTVLRLFDHSWQVLPHMPDFFLSLIGLYFREPFYHQALDGGLLARVASAFQLNGYTVHSTGNCQILEGTGACFPILNVASIRKYAEFERSVVAVVVVRGHIDPSAGSFARKHTPALF